MDTAVLQHEGLTLEKNYTDNKTKILQLGVLGKNGEVLKRENVLLQNQILILFGKVAEHFLLMSVGSDWELKGFNSRWWCSSNNNNKK